MRDLLDRYRALSVQVQRAIGALEAALETSEDDGQSRDLATGTISRVDVPTSDIDALLAFQESLSEIEGVLKVTVAGSSSGRSSFLVELAQEEAPARHRVVCARCGKAVEDGIEPPSHGLCDDCAEELLRR